jgi:SAM-dependent methyltransferase
VSAPDNPRSFDHLAEEHDFVATLERTPAFFLANLPPQRRRVLDVGCGTGLLAHELSRHFAAVVAIDISEPMLAIARAKRSAPNIEYRREDANHLALHQEFDFIVSHSAFHHLDNIPETLRVLKSALQPGGRLALVDNAARFPMIPRHSGILIANALVKLPLDLLRHDRPAVWRLFRFRTSRPWLDHVKGDTILSRARFREVYGRCLPGASFVPLNHFMGVVWQAPASRE